MLAREQRLAKRSDILRVYRYGRSTKQGQLALRVFWVKDPALIEGRTATVRFAVVVPNKLSKKATVRNKIKRRIREALRKLPIQTGYPADVVVSAFPSAKDMTFDEILAILHALARSARLL